MALSVASPPTQAGAAHAAWQIGSMITGSPAWIRTTITISNKELAAQSPSSSASASSSASSRSDSSSASSSPAIASAAASRRPVGFRLFLQFFHLILQIGMPVFQIVDDFSLRLACHAVAPWVPFDDFNSTVCAVLARGHALAVLARYGLDVGITPWRSVRTALYE
jgi:hypothetical protein